MRARFLDRRLVAAVLTAGGALACESPLSPHDRDALRVAEARWKSREQSSYTFEIRRACFCPPVLAEWARVQVSNGLVAGVVVLATGEEVPAAERAMFPTIDQVFETIHHTIDSDWIDRIELTFDPVTGLPTFVSFVSKSNIADAGGAYYLRNLIAIP